MTEQRGLDSFARVPLLFGPSPVHRLDRLSEHLGGEDAVEDQLRGPDVRVVVPLRSKRMCANFETYTSSRTPYCNL